MVGGKTRGWLGSRLNVSPEDIKLFIDADYSGFVSRPRETKVFLADSVQYVHHELGMVDLGPNFIRVDGRVVVAEGYASPSFRSY